ncbi:hypothetical protein ONZ45_g16511 [Pleurotus djamor]|nr:hypothetical protein ONZ45_g16511 [Pleurotus djamor]
MPKRRPSGEVTEEESSGDESSSPSSDSVTDEERVEVAQQQKKKRPSDPASTLRRSARATAVASVAALVQSTKSAGRGGKGKSVTSNLEVSEVKVSQKTTKAKTAKGVKKRKVSVEKAEESYETTRKLLEEEKAHGKDAPPLWEEDVATHIKSLAPSQPIKAIVLRPPASTTAANDSSGTPQPPRTPLPFPNLDACPSVILGEKVEPSLGEEGEGHENEDDDDQNNEDNRDDKDDDNNTDAEKEEEDEEEAEESEDDEDDDDEDDEDDDDEDNEERTERRRKDEKRRGTHQPDAKVIVTEGNKALVGKRNPKDAKVSRSKKSHLMDEDEGERRKSSGPKHILADFKYSDHDCRGIAESARTLIRQRLVLEDAFPQSQSEFIWETILLVCKKKQDRKYMKRLQRKSSQRAADIVEYVGYSIAHARNVVKTAASDIICASYSILGMSDDVQVQAKVSWLLRGNRFHFGELNPQVTVAFVTMSSPD